MICRDCMTVNWSGREYCSKCSGELYGKHLNSFI
ncbi:MAG: hypothetical protein AWU54_407 [Candidatus Frackibacter sp. T328-2]|jgi:uncharacterized OB-fold protein|nr:MAG: hypothetical protein AWU54_407 [Candidatus Frackibacter sp. T328-2]